MLGFWQFCDFQKLTKVHRSQQNCAAWSTYLEKIFHSVCDFRPLFHICDILCYSEAIRLENAKVGKESGQNLQIFALQNVADIDRPPCDLRYKITPHSHILAKVGGVPRPRSLQREKK